VSVDERSRLQLAEAAKRFLGDDEGITLMELLPPVGWADVATRHDLAALESRIDTKLESLEHRLTANFERGLRTMLLAMMTLFVTGFVATIVATVLAIALR
jgi:hypothetical protein